MKTQSSGFIVKQFPNSPHLNAKVIFSVRIPGELRIPTARGAGVYKQLKQCTVDPNGQVRRIDLYATSFTESTVSMSRRVSNYVEK